MAAGEARKKVRPGNGAGVGVGHVDLHLRDDHHHTRQQQRHGGGLGQVVEGHLVHVHRVGGLAGGGAAGEGEVGEEGAEQHFDHADQYPSGAGQGEPEPPAIAVFAGFFRHEAQVVHLLADLRHHGEEDRAGGAEQHPVEAVAARCLLRREPGPVLHAGNFKPGGREQCQALQQQPQGLGADLEFADGADAVGHDGNHRQRTEDIADGRGYAEQGVQGGGEDRCFDGEKDKREGGVDQRGDGGAQVAEAGTAGEQVDVQAVFGGVVADGEAGHENDHSHGEHRGHGVDETVVQGDRGGNGLQGQEGGGAQRGLGHLLDGPAAPAHCCEAQGEILEGLVPHPLVVVPADAEYLLRGSHGVVPVVVIVVARKQSNHRVATSRCTSGYSP